MTKRHSKMDKKEHIISLTHQARKYFEKKLQLINEINDDILDDTIMEDEPESIPSQDLPKDENTTSKDLDNSEDILVARKILENFPIDKTKYSPERVYLEKISFFDDIANPDKILNSLLFATKLSYFTNSIESVDILQEISTDSFGYMNLLRKSQQEILDEEVTKINKKNDFLNSSQLNSNFVRLGQIKRSIISEKEEYLASAMEFYVYNVFTKSVDHDQALLKLEIWLNESMENRKE